MIAFLEKHYKVRNWLYIFIGALMYSLAVNLFLSGNNIAAGGVSGIATILSKIFPIKISVFVLAMNVPLLALSILLKGWAFTKNTIIGTLIFTFTVEVTSYLPTLTNDPLVATVFGGALNGTGLACLVLGNGSTGGTEIISRILVKYFPNIGYGRMAMFVDGLVVISAMVVFRNIEVGLYAILAIYVCSMVADKLLLGFDKGTLCLIITSRPSCEIAKAVMEKFNRTVTEIEGRGMYSESKKNVLLVAIKPAQTPRLKNILSSIDPDAFVIVMPATEILGQGFKALSVSAKRP